MRILVVDDQWQLLQAIGLMLESLGSPPSLALGAAAGLQHLENESFDWILCDVQMPGFSGPQFFQEIQKKNLPVFPEFVFMSGKATEASLVMELGLSQVKLLRKPFNLQSLKAALHLGDEKRSENR